MSISKSASVSMQLSSLLTPFNCNTAFDVTTLQFSEGTESKNGGVYTTSKDVIDPAGETEAIEL